MFFNLFKRKKTPSDSEKSEAQSYRENNAELQKLVESQNKALQELTKRLNSFDQQMKNWQNAQPQQPRGLPYNGQSVTSQRSTDPNSPQLNNYQNNLQHGKKQNNVINSDGEPVLLPYFPKMIKNELMKTPELTDPLYQITNHIIAFANDTHRSIRVVQLNNLLVIALSLIATTSDSDDKLRASYEKTPPYISQFGFDNPVVIDQQFQNFGEAPIKHKQAKQDAQLKWINPYLAKLLDQKIGKVIKIIQSKHWYQQYSIDQSLPYTDLYRFFKSNRDSQKQTSPNNHQTKRPNKTKRHHKA